MNKVILVSFLICSLALSSCSLNLNMSNNQETSSDLKMDSDVETDMSYSNMVNDQFDKLVEHWGGEYPDYYGGCYIKDHSFTVLVTCEPEKVADEIRSEMGNQDVIILKAEYSYNDLRKAQDEVTDILFGLQEKNDEAAGHVIGIGVDEKQNDVEVEVLNMTDEIKASLQDLLSSYPMVRFVNADEPYRPL